MIRDVEQMSLQTGPEDSHGRCGGRLSHTRAFLTLPYLRGGQVVTPAQR